MIHTNHFSGNSIYFITSFLANVLFCFVVYNNFKAVVGLMSRVLMMFKKDLKLLLK